MLLPICRDPHSSSHGEFQVLLDVKVLEGGQDRTTPDTGYRDN